MDADDTGMVVHLEPDRVRTDEGIALYNSVGWSAYTAVPQYFHAMFENASFVATARSDDGRLIGLVRVVGDGVTVAVVQDLLVHPAYQGRGIGGELVDRALQATQHLGQTYITTDATPDNQQIIDLYVRRGFVLSPDWGLCTLALLR